MTTTTPNDTPELRQKILELTGKRGASFPTDISQPFPFGAILEEFVHLAFPDEEAVVHWQNIIATDGELREKLGRPTSIYLAIADYFTNARNLLKAPLLIELYLFEETEKLIMVDPLTGSFNRRYMNIFLKKEIYRCRRYSKELSVCMIDIDNFKSVNDTRGHLFGDETLKTLAEMFRESIREEDVLCRFGGEEFLLILPETNSAGAKTLVERMQKLINSSPFFSSNGISFSGGIACLPEHAQNQESLIRKADECLYEAKRLGKNRIVAATKERRRASRHCGKWNIEIQVSGEEETVSGARMKNISEGGISFQSARLYPLNSVIQIVFTEKPRTVFGGKRAVTGNPETKISGKITWSKKHRNGYSYGVEFLESPEKK